MAEERAISARLLSAVTNSGCASTLAIASLRRNRMRESTPFTGSRVNFAKLGSSTARVGDGLLSIGRFAEVTCDFGTFFAACILSFKTARSSSATVRVTGLKSCASSGEIGTQ